MCFHSRRDLASLGLAGWPPALLHLLSLLKAMGSRLLLPLETPVSSYAVWRYQIELPCFMCCVTVARSHYLMGQGLEDVACLILCQEQETSDCSFPQFSERLPQPKSNTTAPRTWTSWQHLAPSCLPSSQLLPGQNLCEASMEPFPRAPGITQRSQRGPIQD